MTGYREVRVFRLMNLKSEGIVFLIQILFDEMKKIGRLYSRLFPFVNDEHKLNPSPFLKYFLIINKFNSHV